MELNHNSSIPNENHLTLIFDVEPSVKNEQLMKKKKGLQNLLSINALVCGVEIVASCIFTFIPPQLLKAGFSEFLMTTILGVAPFIDMITVPLLAEWSDRSTLRMGKRRPVIIGLSVILFCSLITVSFSSEIASTLYGSDTNSWHMFILTIGVILLDYSCQAIFNPCEALLADMMANCDKRFQTQAFSIYSACLSLGCIIGYLIVCIKWTSIIPFNLLQEQMCFLIITLLLVPCLALTLSNKEAPIEIQKNEPYNYAKVYEILGYFKQKRREMFDLGSDYTIQKFGWGMLYLGVCLLTIFQRAVNFGRNFLKGIILLPIGCYKRIQAAPAVIQRVFFVELFGWTTLHCHDRFFTDFIGQYVYEGSPSAQENSPEANLYDEGIIMGSWCLFLQSLAACLYSFFIQHYLVQLVGPRAVFIGGIFVLFLSMILSFALPSLIFLKVTTTLSGIGTAALTTTPNMLVTLYSQKKNVYMSDLLDDREKCDTPSERGIGAEVAVLDMAFYLSQIILSFCLGPLIEIFKSSILYMAVSTLTSAITCYCASKVVFNQHDFQLMIKGQF